MQSRRPGQCEDVKSLTPDRFRAVLGLLATVTVKPVGKGSNIFNPDRVTVQWLQPVGPE